MPRSFITGVSCWIALMVSILWIGDFYETVHELWEGVSSIRMCWTLGELRFRSGIKYPDSESGRS